MRTTAAMLSKPGHISLADLALRDPAEGEVVVEIDHAAISTGTEKLLWDGAMPQFPGMGYPLVPGYEAVGCVVDAGAGATCRNGDRVFVPGAHCFPDARSLFGANARHLVVKADRLVDNSAMGDERGVLLALAATAHHALAARDARAPELIVGHGTLGRLLTRIAIARGMASPVVWEKDPARRAGRFDYCVTDAESDERRDYAAIYDCSGDAALLPELIGRIARGGEIVLAGFYPGAVSFPFAPAFMREARFRIAAEWAPADMDAVLRLIADGRLSLDGLITHHRPAREIAAAYPQAFEGPACRKMVLDWGDA
ncbi:chlorophyll synthesis pathway protein BchC [Erythrobacter sp. LQ02-29]|uniref:chlorophyll synthesis pathway protein BchC n=1 Tax=Erythrobacter sp. LQ02-29 TaxID=2920384 RepID=UPI001F4DFC7B|nr:chlorophyll synthesis pathway protein BchC [Erythrobacter sp. LQ02-29]MCP9221143.1 chlorophyll synthesis pathway protein BchC [Erythrobacter sp. LQ02-29]